MKATRITSTAILSLVFGLAAPANAQQEQPGEKQGHPKQEQSRREPAQQRQGRNEEPQHSRQQQPDRGRQPERAQQQQRQDRNEQPQHGRQQQQPNRERQQPQYAQQERRNDRPRSAQEQREPSAWREHRARRWESDHRTWEQRGGYRGYHIPDDRFRGYFGPQHGFRIHGLPFQVVRGYPRFQYGGYWVSAVDPWPEYWADDWYDTDYVYVNYYDNGYYLYNRRYPTAPGIAISISF